MTAGQARGGGDDNNNRPGTTEQQSFRPAEGFT
jgi:hypothetical protein